MCLSNIFWICGIHAKSTLASFQADEYHTYLINLGNDDDVPGAPACFAVILLALVTLSKGKTSFYIEAIYMGISSEGLVFMWQLFAESAVKGNEC